MFMAIEVFRLMDLLELFCFPAENVLLVLIGHPIEREHNMRLSPLIINKVFWEQILLTHDTNWTNHLLRQVKTVTLYGSGWLTGVDSYADGMLLPERRTRLERKEREEGILYPANTTLTVASRSTRTNGISQLIPMQYPSMSPEFKRKYSELMISLTTGIPDTDCLICFSGEEQEKTIEFETTCHNDYHWKNNHHPKYDERLSKKKTGFEYFDDDSKFFWKHIILKQAQARQAAGGPVFDPDMSDFMRRFLEHAAKTSIIPGFSNVPGYEEEFKKMQEALKNKDQPKEEKKKADEHGAGCSQH
ncbi:hypothetical protein GCK72_010971 [Caenorhabditis remanei]|uniref:Uncharacterized protein n=1 Tax=Caenorhabditis remanei TaxID=31234 RepID=A0A6A5H6L6_CAERE|nr:hypothetical protein GCK72_010971 [Caenorhabditis remanei]KAF1762709.1 hypothetical protein GCK72_010971 [Caenorhabditis remanei]